MTPHALLLEVERAHPGVWGTYARALSMRGRDLPDWPAWCYAPLAAAAVVDPGDVARVGAAAAWRARPLVWRDAEPAGALDLDASAVLDLPRWCTWIDAPVPMLVHLEHDAGDSRRELRLLLAMPSAWVPVPVHLDHPTLADALDAALAEVAAHVPALVYAESVRDGWARLLRYALPYVARLAREPRLAVEVPGA